MRTCAEERQNEDEMLAAEKWAADGERALRARELLEALRQAEIESARAAAGLCIHCGERLATITRRLGARRHPRCRTFRE